MDDTTVDRNKKKVLPALLGGKIQILFSVITKGKSGEQQQSDVSTETFYIGGHVKKPIKVFERRIKSLSEIGYTKTTQKNLFSQSLGLDDSLSTEGENGITRNASQLDPCFGYLSNKGKQKWGCYFKYSSENQQLGEDVDSEPQISTDYKLVFINSEKKDRNSQLLPKEYWYTECNSAAYFGNGFFLKSPQLGLSFLYHILAINRRTPENRPRANKNNHQITPANIVFTGGENSDTYTITVIDPFISFTETKFESIGSITTRLDSQWIHTGGTTNSGGTGGNIYGWTGIPFVAMWNPAAKENDPPERIFPRFGPTDLVVQSVQDGYLVPNTDLSSLKKIDAYHMPFEMGDNYYLYQSVFYIFPESRWAFPTFFGGINTSQGIYNSDVTYSSIGIFWGQPYSIQTWTKTTYFGRKLVTVGGSSAAGELMDTMVPEYGPLDGSLSLGVSSYDPPGTLPHTLLVKGSEFIPRGVSNGGVISDEPPHDKTTQIKSTEAVSLVYYGGGNGATIGGEGTVISYKVGADTIKERIVISSNQENNKILNFSAEEIPSNILLRELNSEFTQVGLVFYNVEAIQKIGSVSKVWTQDENHTVAMYEYKNGKYEKTVKEYKAFSFGYNEKNKPKVCMIHAYSFHPN